MSALTTRDLELLKEATDTLEVRAKEYVLMYNNIRGLLNSLDQLDQEEIKNHFPFLSDATTALMILKEHLEGQQKNGFLYVPKDEYVQEVSDTYDKFYNMFLDYIHEDPETCEMIDDDRTRRLEYLEDIPLKFDYEG